MEKIVWHLETRKISELRDYHKNPRRLTKDQRDHIQKSIEKFGIIDKPIVNLDNTIIGGHQRKNVLLKMGIDEVECNIPSRPLDEKEIEELNFRLNGNHGEFDDDILANQYEFEELIQWGYELIEPPEEKEEKKKFYIKIDFKSSEDVEAIRDKIEDLVSSYDAKIKVKNA
jgi:hypothetical protein